MSTDMKQQRLHDKFASVLKLSEQDGELATTEMLLMEDTLKEIFKLKKKNLTDAKTYKQKALINGNEQADVITNYYRQLRKDLYTFCMNVVELIDSKILPKIQSAQGKVFFMKIKGDFYRYSLECLRKGDQLHKANLQEGFTAYSKAYEIGIGELSCENKVFLNLCLNFSVFYYTAGEDLGKACELVSETLNKLEERKEAVLPEIWKSVQPTMCLLQNNLVLWLNEAENDHHSN